MFEVDEASRLITESCDPNANIIFGTSIDERFTGEIKITVIATGFSEETNSQIGNMSRGGFGQSRLFPATNNQGTQAQATPPAKSFNTFNPPLQREVNNDPQNDYDVPAFLRNKLNK